MKKLVWMGPYASINGVCVCVCVCDIVCVRQCMLRAFVRPCVSQI